MRVSSRVASLKPSATVAVANLARSLQAKGVDVLSFAAGEPDFDTPQRIKQAAIDALLGGQTKYMPTLGDMKTREVIAEKLTKENGIPGLTGEHVAICSGGKHALYVAFQCLLDAQGGGDGSAGGGVGGGEVVLPVPTWVSYAPLAELAGGKIVEVSTSASNDFLVSPEDLRAALTTKTRVIVLCTPSNPTGTMYGEGHLRALAGVISEAAQSLCPDVVVIVDEMYEKIVFGETPHFSFGSIPEVANRTITVNGLSKAYAMTGWRVGYAAMPGEFGARFIRSMGTLQGQMTTNITSFVYPAVRTALTSCADDVERMRLAFAGRAELIYGLVSSMRGLRCVRPTGAFYVFPDVSETFGMTTPKGKTIGSALDFCGGLLDEVNVAAVPGEDFGGVGGDHVRFSFACSEEQIREGMQRLGDFVESLR